MTFSLYAATVPSYRQILDAVARFLVKAEVFCAEKGIPPTEIVQARLAADMQPFSYQVKSTAVHSLGAIEGVRKGVFSPDMTQPPGDFAGLKARITETLAALDAIDPAEIDASWAAACALRSVTAKSSSPPRIFCCLSRSRTSTSTRPLPTTSCAGRASRSGSAISWGSFARRPKAPKFDEEELPWEEWPAARLDITSHTAYSAGGVGAGLLPHQFW